MRPSRSAEERRPRRAPPCAPREQRPGAEGGGRSGQRGTAESRHRGRPGSREDPRRGRPPPPAIQRRRGRESAALTLLPRPTERLARSTPRPRLWRHCGSAALTSRCPAAAAAQHPPHPPLPAPAPRTGSAHGPARRAERGGALGVGGLRLDERGRGKTGGAEPQ